MESASRSRAGFRPFKGLVILSRQGAGGKESTRGGGLSAPRALECVQLAAAFGNAARAQDVQFRKAMWREPNTPQVGERPLAHHLIHGNFSV